MKEKIRVLIQDFVKEYEKQENIVTKWGTPQVGFADAKHPMISQFKTLIGPNHGTPDEVMEDASIVIAYYVPFTKELANTNQNGTNLASREWAIAYEETNAMFKDMDESGESANSVGSDVCGKCVTQSPCAFWNLSLGEYDG